MTSAPLAPLEAIEDAALPSADAAALLAEIDAWCVRTGTTHTAFGQLGARSLAASSACSASAAPRAPARQRSPAP